MPYSISKTNGTLLTTIFDGTVDNSTDLVFIGKNYTGYGDPINENFVKLLENFANTVPPSRPLTGQLWFDSNTNRLKLFNGNRYKNLAVISTGTSFPIDSTIGDMHFNGSLFYSYTGISWLPIGPLSASSTGAELPITSVITEDQSVRSAVSITINESSSVVLSTSSAYSVFTADPLYNKYPGIYPGLNLPDTDENGISGYYDTGSNLGNLFWGTAGSALGLVDYSNSVKTIVRVSDLALKSDLSGGNGLVSLTLSGDDGIVINDTFQLHVTYDQGVAASTISNIKNNIIKFNVNTDQGTYTNFINFDARSGFFRVLPTTATSVSLGSSNVGERFSNLHVRDIFSDQASITTVTSTRIVSSTVSATQISISGNAVVGGSLQIGTTSTINNARILTTATLTDNSQLANGAGYLTSATVGNHAVASVSGTVNQINVSSSTGNVTLSLSDNLEVINLDADYISASEIYMNGSIVLTEATVPSDGIFNVLGTPGQITTSRAGGVVTVGLPEEVTVSTLRATALFDSNNRVLTGATAVTSFSAGTTGLTPFGANTGAITLGGTLGVSNGGTGATSLTGYVKGNGTGAFTAVAKVPYSDLSGAPTNVSAFVNDTGYITRSFPAGTKMIFAQIYAPTGWTRITSYDNHALRVVNGSAGTGNTTTAGGSVNFTAAFTSQSVSGTVGGTALTEAQMPSHTHYTLAQTNVSVATEPSGTNQVARGSDVGGDTEYILQGTNTSATVGRTSASGSGQSHTHSFSGTAINLAVKYVDVIIASKD